MLKKLIILLILLEFANAAGMGVPSVSSNKVKKVQTTVVKKTTVVPSPKPVVKNVIIPKPTVVVKKAIVPAPAPAPKPMPSISKIPQTTIVKKTIVVPSPKLVVKNVTIPKPTLVVKKAIVPAPKPSPSISQSKVKIPQTTIVKKTTYVSPVPSLPLNKVKPVVKTTIIKKTTTYVVPIPTITHVTTYSIHKAVPTHYNKYYNPITIRTYHPLVAYYHPIIYNPTGYYSTVYHLKYYDGYGYNFYYGGYGYYEYSVHKTIHRGKVSHTSATVYSIIAVVIILSICCLVCCIRKHRNNQYVVFESEASPESIQFSNKDEIVEEVVVVREVVHGVQYSPPQYTPTPHVDLVVAVDSHVVHQLGGDPTYKNPYVIEAAEEVHQRDMSPAAVITVERLNHQVVVEEQSQFISETLIHDRQPDTYPAVAYANEYQQDQQQYNNYENQQPQNNYPQFDNNEGY